MKMEHAVAAPASGVVAEILVEVGDQVERGQPLAIVEPGAIDGAATR
jgi:propionyl-CoA carboxylase alpha chain